LERTACISSKVCRTTHRRRIFQEYSPYKSPPVTIIIAEIK
jgi:hypothetical protein